MTSIPTNTCNFTFKALFNRKKERHSLKIINCLIVKMLKRDELQLLENLPTPKVKYTRLQEKTHSGQLICTSDNSAFSTLHSCDAFAAFQTIQSSPGPALIFFSADLVTVNGPACIPPWNPVTSSDVHKKKVAHPGQRLPRKSR